MGLAHLHSTVTGARAAAGGSPSPRGCGLPPSPLRIPDVTQVWPSQVSVRDAVLSGTPCGTKGTGLLAPFPRSGTQRLSLQVFQAQLLPRRGQPGSSLLPERLEGLGSHGELGKVGDGTVGEKDRDAGVSARCEKMRGPLTCKRLAEQNKPQSCQHEGVQVAWAVAEGEGGHGWPSRCVGPTLLSELGSWAQLCLHLDTQHRDKYRTHRSAERAHTSPLGSTHACAHAHTHTHTLVHTHTSTRELTAKKASTQNPPKNRWRHTCAHTRAHTTRPRTQTHVHTHTHSSAAPVKATVASAPARGRRAAGGGDEPAVHRKDSSTLSERLTQKACVLRILLSPALMFLAEPGGGALHCSPQGGQVAGF